MSLPPRNAVLAPYGILDTPPEPGFDDAVALAQHLCDAPIALVSLVADDRQWFKARLGLPDHQTDLDRSVCRFVVEKGEPIVIEDMRLDPRTAENPLVVHDPCVRFYAGAPLTMSNGDVLGALCVLDTVPRPGGLTPEQQEHLSAIARSVSQQLDLRRAMLVCNDAVTARAAEEERRHKEERRWGDLFHTMREAFIIGSLVRDDAGQAVDWRFDEVNRAWGDLIGIDPLVAVGRTVREVLPAIDEAWVTEPAEAVSRGEAIRFTREVGSLERWYDGIVQPTGGDTFTILFVEVTDRVDTQRRFDAMLDIADCSRQARTVAEMTRGIVAIAGGALRASRAGFGMVDADTRQVVVEPDWTLPGETSIAGTHRFEDFGQIRDELARAEPLVIDDVATDPRTAVDPGPLMAVNVRALVNMPVRERGRTSAIFFVHSATKRAWAPDELLFMRAVADRLEGGVARIGAEDQQRILNGELSHRLKNSLAMVQAIASQTLRGEDPAKVAALLQRIRALGTAHDVLLGRGARSADLKDLVAQVLSAAGAEGRYAASGPMTLLGARATLSTSLLLHELATNALKYGALSAAGRVEISWREDGDGGFTLDWIERGGPLVTEPTRKGFGSRLLSLGLVGTGGATLRYNPEGLSATFSASREHLESA